MQKYEFELYMFRYTIHGIEIKIPCTLFQYMGNFILIKINLASTKIG